MQYFCTQWQSLPSLLGNVIKYKLYVTKWLKLKVPMTCNAENRFHTHHGKLTKLCNIHFIFASDILVAIKRKREKYCLGDEMCETFNQEDPA